MSLITPESAKFSSSYSHVRGPVDDFSKNENLHHDHSFILSNSYLTHLQQERQIWIELLLKITFIVTQYTHKEWRCQNSREKNVNKFPQLYW